MVCDLIFVYGTLRASVRPDVHGRFLGERAEWIGEGSVAGLLWRVSWYPAMTPSQLPTDRVIGEVYRLADPGLMMAALDEFEVCDLENPSEAEYSRSLVEVTLADGASVTAWCYSFLGKTAGLMRIPSGDFSI